jgi:hypothetical protein
MFKLTLMMRRKSIFWDKNRGEIVSKHNDFLYCDDCFCILQEKREASGGCVAENASE